MHYATGEPLFQSSTKFSISSVLQNCAATSASTDLYASFIESLEKMDSLPAGLAGQDFTFYKTFGSANKFDLAARLSGIPIYLSVKTSPTLNVQNNAVHFSQEYYVYLPKMRWTLKLAMDITPGYTASKGFTIQVGNYQATLDIPLEDKLALAAPLELILPGAGIPALLSGDSLINKLTNYLSNTVAPREIGPKVSNNVIAALHKFVPTTLKNGQTLKNITLKAPNTINLNYCYN